jgi:hypothetical protein
MSSLLLGRYLPIVAAFAALRITMRFPEKGASVLYYCGRVIATSRS